MKYEYVAVKLRMNWDGGNFQLEVEANKHPMTINAFGQLGWELVGFYPDAHAIGDISTGYKDGRDGWVPPDERVAIFKRGTQ